MEKNTLCKNHNLLLEFYCPCCQVIICKKCIKNHGECNGILYLSDFAERNVLPRYEKLIKNLEAKESSIENSIDRLFNSMKDMKESLIKVKKDLKKSLEIIEKIIESIPERLINVSAIYNTSRYIRNYKALKNAIKSDNIEYIAKNIDDKFAINLIITDEDEILIEKLQSLLSTLPVPHKFEMIKDCFIKLIQKCKDYNEIYNEEFVYGVCNPQNGYRKLCKYDVIRKKLMPLIDIRKNADISQINKRIFISGGSDPIANLVDEYIEDTQILVPKKPMNYDKYSHAIEPISTTKFASIGGYNHSEIPNCEEYDIALDVWKILPSLNKSRYQAGSALISNRYLYAIGGIKSNNTIEMLDLNSKNQWIIVDLTSNELNFSGSPASFSLSDSEIAICCGGNTTIAGIYNIETKIIKKCAEDLMPECYYSNSFVIIKGIAYIIGEKYGHIHTCDIANRKFEDIDYSKIYP